MGEHARRVAARLRATLSTVHPAFDWTSEYAVGRTSVDVAGSGPSPGTPAGTSDGGDTDTDGPSGSRRSDGELRLVELEWRRADPSNNTAKLFRALVEGAGETADATDDAGALASGFDRVVVVQLFTGYYDLVAGGYSTKRLTASFVGDRVARTVDPADYRAVTLPIDPPTRGGDLPDGWRETVDETARALFECDS